MQCFPCGPSWNLPNNVKIPLQTKVLFGVSAYSKDFAQVISIFASIHTSLGLYFDGQIVQVRLKFTEENTVEQSPPSAACRDFSIAP